MGHKGNLASLVVALLISGAAACGGPGANSARRSLPPYGGHGAELFDDVIEPRGVGLELDQSSVPKSDPALRERVQVGDATLRVRVTTVTTKQEDTGPSYQIAFRVVQQLAGANPPGETFSVRVERRAPAAGILRTFESRLVGKTFIAFVRAFAKEGGDEEVHFHLAPDTKDVQQAVSEAAALSELK